MSDAQAIRVLKRDAFGRVERVEADGRVCTRRVACGGRIPGSGLAARVLLARERRALGALDGQAGVPRVIEDARLAGLAAPDDGAPRARDVLLRSWIDGAPLSQAEALPADFFDRLDELVLALHARGVCHNDLHKEQNVLVRADGRPALIDFQLASVHAARGRAFPAGRGRAFEVRAREDLRHVQKHRRRYLRDGRGPFAAPGRDGDAAARAAIAAGRGHGLERSPLARAWRRLGKPVYVLVTRSILRTRDGEERRPSSGPWPRWTEAVGPAAGGDEVARSPSLHRAPGALS
jgi:predicted Ser/Thr protein kinase